LVDVLKRVARLGLLAALLWAAPAHAEETRQAPSVEEEVALSLFQSGLEAAEAADWNKALDLFSRSRHVIETPACVLNIALVKVRLGRFAAALRDLQRHEELIAASANDEARDRAAQIRTEIGSFIAWLTVRPLPPGGSVEVEGEGRYVATGSELRVPLDPGKARLSVEAPGYVPEVLSIEVTRGQELSAHLNLRPQPAPFVAPSAQGPVRAPPPPRATQRSPQSTAITMSPNRARRVMIPLGATMTGAGAITGVLTFLITYVRGSVGSSGLKRDEYDRLVTANTVGWSAFAVGGVLTVVGVLLPRATKSRGISPRPTLGSAGLTWGF